MEIGKLRSVAFLQNAGKMDLRELSTLMHLRMRINSLDAAVSDADLAHELRKVGPDAAQQLWKFLDGLPAKAGASGHFHFATGLNEPSMAPPGSIACEAAIKWSEILSEAIDLVGHDFTDIAQVKPTFERMEKLLDDDTDSLITARLRFFQVGNTGDYLSHLHPHTLESVSA